MTAVQTSPGSFEGDVFLMAVGAWSEALAKRFGFQLPAQAGKGIA